MIGLIGGLYRRARPKVGTPERQAAARRPIRLPGNEPDASRPVEPDPRPSPGPFWPWLVGTLTLLALVSIFGTGFYLVDNRSDRRLANAITAAADRDDPNWRLDDIMANREDVPDDENSARVVAGVFALLPEDWPTGPKLEAFPGEPKDASGRGHRPLRGAISRRPRTTSGSMTRRPTGSGSSLRRMPRRSRSPGLWPTAATGEGGTSWSSARP